jgi:DNA alkylation repair enzyme
VRDALRRHRGLTHDEITSLSSELWSVPVYERRLAAVVLLQSKTSALDNADLTRIEGFLRTAGQRELADPLAMDVVGPLVSGLDPLGGGRADSVLDRWAGEENVWLRRGALLSPLRAFRAGGGDWGAFVRHARLAQSRQGGQDEEAALVREAIAVVLAYVGKHRPELEFTTPAT